MCYAVGEVTDMKKVVKQDEFVCGDCKHFIQHYRKDVGKEKKVRYVEVGCGHCIFPRIKQRARWETCPRWEAREP